MHLLRDEEGIKAVEKLKKKGDYEFEDDQEMV